MPLHAAVLCLLLAGCAASPTPSPDRYGATELDRREAQVARGLAGARDPAAERELLALACTIAPSRCGRLRVYVVDAESPQARAWPNGMLLVHGALFDQLDDEAELAFALAHELAHLELGHFEAVRGPALEIDADAWALRRLQALGYRGDAGATLLRRLSLLRTRRPPAIDARLDALGAQRTRLRSIGTDGR